MSGTGTLLSLCPTTEVPEGGALKVERDGLILAVFNLGNQFYVTDDAYDAIWKISWTGKK